LLISNFTLYGDMRKWTKLDFSDSANFSEAKPIYDELVRKLQEKWIRLQTGEFGAMMKVSSLNDGPINIIWEE
jgi:D-tyrosyl-tRNA(Tyr) deacylase